jgi:hypothetical protein
LSLNLSIGSAAPDKHALSQKRATHRPTASNQTRPCDWQTYRLDNLLKDIAQIRMATQQFFVVEIAIVDRDQQLVHFVCCLIELCLNKSDQWLLSVIRLAACMTATRGILARVQGGRLLQPWS